MIFLSLMLEVLGYSIKIILLLAFWLVILESVFNWLKMPNNSPFVRLVRAIVAPVLLLLRKKFPFLVQQNIDFTSILVLFLITFLLLTIVYPLIDFGINER